VQDDKRKLYIDILRYVYLRMHEMSHTWSCVRGQLEHMVIGYEETLYGSRLGVFTKT